MPTRKAITKKMDDNTSVEENVKNLEPSSISDNNVECNNLQSLWEFGIKET